MELILDMGRLVWYVLQSPLVQFLGLLAVMILVAWVIADCLDRGREV